MESTYCYEEDFAKCECEEPEVKVCERHLDEHFKKVGRHRVTVLKNKALMVNPIFKNSLIEKIREIVRDAMSKHEEISKFVKESIRNLKSAKKTCLQNIQDFIGTCEEIVEQIQNFHEISGNFFFTPLERALINFDEKILLKIEPISLSFPDSQANIHLDFPNFPHFLYNYSSKAVGFKNSSEILSFPPKCSIKNLNFNSNSRCLQVSSSEMIFTGGEPYNYPNNPEYSTCFLLDFEKKKLHKLSDLNFSRKWHAMSWINGFPCVLGGSQEKTLLKSVEILVNDNWAKGVPMNFARSGPSAVCTCNGTFVIGGVNEEVSKSIEKFTENSWVVLEFHLPFPCSLGIVVTNGVGIVIIGGVDSNKKKNSSVSFVSFREEWKQIMELESETYFNQNCCILRHGRIIAVDNNADIKEFPLRKC